MSLIKRMRRQDAIYWPLAGTDDFGKPAYGPLVELTLVDGVNSRVRWEADAREFIDTSGTTAISRAVVYVPVLPDGSEVVPGGVLWLGARMSLTNEANPLLNEGAFEVRQFNKTPNLKASEFLRTAYL